MAIKRGVYNFERKLNAFNKDMLEGGYEKISDFELDTTLYIYEPQSLADLPDEATELDYQKVWSKYSNGGHTNVYLVPYRDLESIDIQITGAAASFNDIKRQDSIAGFTNKKIDTRPTKRFYSFTKLEPSKDPIGNIEFFEENSLSEVLNNDNSIKQTTFSLTKFDPYDGGKDSYYRDVKMFYGVSKPENVDYIQIEFDTPSIIGETGMNNTYGANITREILMEKIGDEYLFNVVSANENGNYITYDSENKLYPNFLVPINTGQEIHWNVPWCWEYIYIQEQQRNLAITGDGFTDSAEAPYGLKHYPGKLYEGTAINVLYTHINNGEFAGVGEQTDFFMKYVVEFGLPRRLSSHGSTYVGSNDSSQGSGLLNLDYTDNSLNGARAINADGTGSWFTETTMLAVDYAYDPSAWIAGSMDLYLSNPQYGVFWQSEDYLTLVKEILNGSPIYQGALFTSEVGILESVKSQNLQEDIRKWNVSNDNKMLLLPWDLVSLTKNYKTEPEFLDSKTIIAIKRPKDRTGIWDWSGGQSLNIVDGNYMYGKYLDNRKIGDMEFTPRKLLFKLDETDLSELHLNYSSFTAGNIKIKFFTEVGGSLVDTYSVDYTNEIAQGRTLSGGTIITWI